ncbi:MAG: phosphoribosylglycinamide formyltransferase [Proteobacteria bacterium]|nr:phosphoribosylglycinamide formyltransferase [Pseudomonadota bacterium]
MGVIKIGAFISGGGSNLQAVIDACDSGQIPGRIVFVASDNPDAGGLVRAEKKGIPTFVTPYARLISEIRQGIGRKLPDHVDLNAILTKQALFTGGAQNSKAERFFTSRILAEIDLLRQMEAYDFDLLILAGFMRTLTPYFIDRVNTPKSLPRIMNIHPALLPAFPGFDGYGDTFRHGCKVGGCTVHFIDYGEDTGPIIGQKSFDILPGDSLDDVKRKGLELEWQLYPQCIQLYAEDRLMVEENRGKILVKIRK